jgi:hypothetical protein
VGVVTHICNPSYLGRLKQGDQTSEAGVKLGEILCQNKIVKGLENCGSVVEH